MATFRPTPELLAAIISRIPEAFIRKTTLRKRVRLDGRKNQLALEQAIDAGVIAIHENLLYDPARLDLATLMERETWCAPSLPAMTDDGLLIERPIVERLAERDAQLISAEAPRHVRLIRELERTPGYILADDLCEDDEDRAALADLLAVEVLGQQGDVVFDPLRVGERTVQSVLEQVEVSDLRRTVTSYLYTQTGDAAPLDDLYTRFGAEAINKLFHAGGYSRFSVKVRALGNQSMTWVRPKDSPHAPALEAAEAAVAEKDEIWRDARALCGETLRGGATDGKTLRAQVLARSYTFSRAAKQLGIKKETLRTAIEAGIVETFEDPEDRERLRAGDVDRALSDDMAFEEIAAFETLSVRDLALVVGISYSTMRRRLERVGVDRTQPTWGAVKGRWNLPDTLDAYRDQVEACIQAREAAKAAAEAERLRKIEEALERERREREALRSRLVAAFPAWKHDRRNEQHISLHIGPPNSGKTYDALQALIRAGSGWYLAPLRLLAFEVFDRLNQQGVPCNLLTGEEYIPVEGATITASTIEMFNPGNSGRCVIIDEAQMLADPDRGWAWTRALMETQSPDIHVIAPQTAQSLVETLAASAAIPCTPIQHDRLAPIEVAEHNWPLDALPPRTILVAFSRRMVLHLKTVLEERGRSVSVVYGSLPPEVRRKQADRFAEGETEICIATDAVGMGLNLPADHVCFYEIEKFDGTRVRRLLPAEVQQIGGRAGRYGYSHAGLVGAVDRADLKQVRELFYQEPKELTHARVAPSVQDLEMIPGSFADRLEQWAAMESIPDSLRSAIKTTDMDERIRLARMLTDDQVEQVGMEAAVKLVNAPTRQSSRAYWYSCARAIFEGRYMPLPPPAPRLIKNGRDLETTETSISCADIYLWLASRREFSLHGQHELEVRQARMEWSTQIDDALLRKIDTMRRCQSCGRRLPRDSRYNICDRCYYDRRYA